MRIFEVEVCALATMVISSTLLQFSFSENTETSQTALEQNSTSYHQFPQNSPSAELTTLETEVNCSTDLMRSRIRDVIRTVEKNPFLYYSPLKAGFREMITINSEEESKTVAFPIGHAILEAKKLHLNAYNLSASTNAPQSFVNIWIFKKSARVEATY